MSNLLPLVTVVVATAISGLVQGTWTNRWGGARALKQAAVRLQGLPMTLGEWDGQAHELRAREVALAEIQGYVFRRYVNRRTGAVASVLVVCGRPGPVSVHTPDVCYQGAGYGEVGAPSRYSCTAGPGADLMVRQFRKQNVASPTQLRVLYGWGSAGAWLAPKHPRVAFARQPVLYKLYVIRELMKSGEALEGGPESDLLNVLLPELQRAIFSP